MKNASIIAALTMSPITMGAVIGLDARSAAGDNSDFAAAAGYTQMRDLLVSRGHTVVGVGSWNAGSLAGIDAVLMREANRPAGAYSAAEAAAIDAFNAAGGGVAFFADGGWESDSLVASNNLVANVLGADLGPTANNPNGLVVTGFAPSPIFDGIASWGTDFVRQLSIGGANPGVDLTLAGGDSDLAVSRDGTGGRGNSAVFGDASWMQAGVGSDYDLNSLQNEQLFLNIVDYLLVPAPGISSVMLATGLLAARRRRA
jgi:hypothetical protein